MRSRIQVRRIYPAAAAMGMWAVLMAEATCTAMATAINNRKYFAVQQDGI